MKSPPIRMGRVSAILIVTFLLGNAGVTAWALYARFEQTNQRRVVQHNFNTEIKAVQLADCLEIEKLKAAQRDRAREDFAKLDETLVLLHLKKTKAIVERATADRDALLRRYARVACPRPVKVPTGGTK